MRKKLNKIYNYKSGKVIIEIEKFKYLLNKTYNNIESNNKVLIDSIIIYPPKFDVHLLKLCLNLKI